MTLLTSANIIELRKRGYDPLGVILTYEDGKKVLDTLEKALAVVEAAKKSSAHFVKHDKTIEIWAEEFMDLKEALAPFQEEK